MRSPFRGFTRSIDLAAPVRSQRWLNTGVHDVTVEDVDTTTIDAGRIEVTFRDNAGALFRHRIFMTERHKPHKPSKALVGLISGLLPRIEEQTLVMNSLADDILYYQILDAFRGMSCRIRVEWGPGYILKWSEEDVAYHIILGDDVLYVASAVQEAKDWAEQQGHRRAFRKLKTLEPIDAEHEDENCRALRLAVSSLQRAQAGDDSDECRFA